MAKNFRDEYKKLVKPRSYWFHRTIGRLILPLVRGTRVYLEYRRHKKWFKYEIKDRYRIVRKDRIDQMKEGRVYFVRLGEDEQKEVLKLREEANKAVVDKPPLPKWVEETLTKEGNIIER